VIVGGSIAGHTAAQTARSLDPTAQITLVTDEPHTFYNRLNLTRFLAQEVTREALFDYTPAWYAEQQVEVLTETRVISLDPIKKLALLSEGRELPYDACILTHGSAASTPPFYRADLPGVFLLRTLADVEGIAEQARPGAPAAYSGAGWAASGVTPDAWRAERVCGAYSRAGAGCLEAPAPRAEDRIFASRGDAVLVGMNPGIDADQLSCGGDERRVEKGVAATLDHTDDGRRVCFAELREKLDDGRIGNGERPPLQSPSVGGMTLEVARREHGEVDPLALFPGQVTRQGSHQVRHIVEYRPTLKSDNPESRHVFSQRRRKWGHDTKVL